MTDEDTRELLGLERRSVVLRVHAQRVRSLLFFYCRSQTSHSAQAPIYESLQCVLLPCGTFRSSNLCVRPSGLFYPFICRAFHHIMYFNVKSLLKPQQLQPGSKPHEETDHHTNKAEAHFGDLATYSACSLPRRRRRSCCCTCRTCRCWCCLSGQSLAQARKGNIPIHLPPAHRRGGACGRGKFGR